MKKISFVVDSASYLNNGMFSLEDKQLNRDNCRHQFHILKKEFHKNGYDLSTQDINPPGESIATIYHDIPKEYENICHHERSFLIYMESPIIRPLNYDVSLHDRFEKIFTNYEPLIDNIRYFKVNYAYPEPAPVDLGKQERKLAALIAANKPNYGEGEGLTERKRTIRWFDKNHQDEFDLYGIAWDRHIFPKTRIGRKLNRLTFLQKLLAKNYKVYQGTVDVKKEVLENYWFSFTYENVKNVSGYITEKIFDSFFAGVIPVYLGADNISEYIPRDCYIDRQDFESMEHLYDFMKNMTLEEKNKRIMKINDFLQSDKFSPFKSETFAKDITKAVLASLEN